MLGIPNKVYRSLLILAACAVAFVIAYLSLIPSQYVPGLQMSDKIKHFLAYGTLAMLVSLALGRDRTIVAFMLCVFYGVGLEIAQHTATTGRDASLLDAVANTLGAGLGVALSRYLPRPPGLFSRDGA